MAKETKRSETLSIRINPLTKAGLSAAAHYSGSSMASVTEKALDEGLNSARVPTSEVRGLLNEAYVEAGSVPISAVIKRAWHSVPLIMQLRLYQIMPSAVGKRERIIYNTIFSSHIFAGNENIFAEHETLEAAITPPINLVKVFQSESSLTKYADLIFNTEKGDSGFKITYHTYLEVQESESDTALPDDFGKFS